MTEEKNIEHNIESYKYPDSTDGGMVCEPAVSTQYAQDLYKHRDVQTLTFSIDIPESLSYNEHNLISLIRRYVQGELLREQQLQKRLSLLVTKWREGTLLLSSPVQIVENKYFKEIVALGDDAVPFILNEIKKEPSNLVWALNMIYKRRITENRKTSVTDACKLWIEELSTN